MRKYHECHRLVEPRPMKGVGDEVAQPGVEVVEVARCAREHARGLCEETLIRNRRGGLNASSNGTWKTCKLPSVASGMGLDGGGEWL